MNIKKYTLKGMWFFNVIPAVLLCIALCISNAASGQSTDKKLLKEVKINAQTVTKQTLTPAQKVSGTDFTRYAANNVADAIRNLSGVIVKDYGGIGGLKTVSVRSLGANHTSVFYDGVQMNDAQNGQVDLGKLSLNNLAEIVLYNGQPDVLLLPARAYASASVLLVKPAKPRVSSAKPTELTAGFKTGSFGLFEPVLQLDQSISRKWSFKINTFNTHANGRYKYQVEGDGSADRVERKNTDIDAFQTDAAVYYIDRDSSNFSIRGNYYKSERGLPGAVIFYNDYAAQRLWNEDVFVQSAYEKKWRNSIQLLINTKLSQSYTRYLDPDYLNIEGELDQRYMQKEYYLSAAVAGRPTKGLGLSYAADGSVNQLRTNLYQFVYPTRLTLLQVVAGQYTAGRSRFQANLLHTVIHESVESGEAAADRSVFSPTLMYSVEPFSQSGLQLRAFYKDIFRNPTFNDLYYTRIGSLSLKPEYVKQFNAGATLAKVYHGKLAYLTLTADAYLNKVRDKIIAVPNKDIFSWSMRNLGKVDIRGLDLSAKTRYQLNNKWAALFAVNYTYQDAVDVTDPASSYYKNNIPYTPQHTGAFNAGITDERIGLFFNHILSSHRYYLSENVPAYRVPGFSVTDVSLSWMFKFSGLPVASSVEVNNLFDTNYAFIRSFPMPGRSVRLSLKVTL
jgi:vitamin B12 transporter